MSIAQIKEDRADNQRRVMAQLQAYRALVSTFEQADRIIANRPLRAAIASVPTSTVPAWTTADGSVITFNLPRLGALETAEDYVRITGVNFHELCHVLFTPVKNAQSYELYNALPKMKMAFNILEDQRIESMLVALAPSTANYFRAMFASFVVNNPDPTTLMYSWMIAHGRRYLDPELVASLRGIFVDQTVCDDIAAIIDEYRTLDLTVSSNIGRAVDLAFKLNAILRTLNPPSLGNQHGDNDHSGCDSKDRDQTDKSHQGSDAVKRGSDQRKPKPEQDKPSADQGSDKDEVAAPDDELPGSASDEEPLDGEDQGEDGQDQDADGSPQGGAGSDHADEDDHDETPDGDAGETQPEPESADEEPEPAPGQGDSEPDSDDTPDDTDSDDGQDEEDDDADDPADAAGPDEGDGDESGTQATAPRAEQAQNGTGSPSQGGGQGAPAPADNDGDDETDEGFGQTAGTGAGDHTGDTGATPEEIAAAIMADVLSSAQVESDYRSFQAAHRRGHQADLLPALDQWTNDAVASSTAMTARLVREFDRIRVDADPGYLRDQASGRLNVGRWMRGADLDTTFDAWHEGVQDAASLETIVLGDISGSMKGNEAALTGASWTIKRALDAIDANCTVMYYDTKTKVVYKASDRAVPNKYPRVNAVGGTEPSDALTESVAIFGASQMAKKLLITMTDGQWGNPGTWSEGIYSGAFTHRENIEAMHRQGAVTCMVYFAPGWDGTPEREAQIREYVDWQGHQIQVVIKDLADLPAVARKLVSQLMRTPTRTR